MRHAIPVLLGALLLPCTTVFPQKRAARSAPPKRNAAGVADGFAAAIVLHPRKILDGRVAKTAVGEIAKSADKRVTDELLRGLEQRFGVKPRNVSRVIVFLEPAAIVDALRGYFLPPDDDDNEAAEKPRPPSPVFFIRLVKPPDRKAVLAAWTRTVTREVVERDKAGAVLNRRLVEEKVPPKQKKHNGATYYDNGETALYFAEDSIIIGGPEPLLKKLLRANLDSTPLTKSLAKVGTGADAAFVLDVRKLARSIAQAPRVDLPRHVVRLLDLTPKIGQVTATVDLTGKLGATLTAETADEKTAAALTELLRNRLLPLAKAIYELQRPTSVKFSPPAWKPLVEFFDGVLDSVQIRRDGKNVVMSANRSPQSAALGRLIGRYFVEEHKRDERKSNLRIVAFAMQFYDEIHTQLPTHGSDASGKRKGLSWRVHILPYLDEEGLYKQFKLDEGWDSPHNKKLIAKMPSIFKTPGVTTKGKTALHVFTGPGTPFGGKAGLRITDIKDGHANTLMAVEAGPDKADVWTKPGGLAFDPKADPWKTLGKTDPVNGFLAAMLDGSVFWMRTWTTAETLQRLIQHADGKPVGDF